MSNKEIFKTEIRLLDKVQNKLFEAIATKPDPNDIEEMRLYIDNTFMTLNSSVMLVKEVKNELQKKETGDSITETYNSPA